MIGFHRSRFFGLTSFLRHGIEAEVCHVEGLYLYQSPLDSNPNVDPVIMFSTCGILKSGLTLVHGLIHRLSMECQVSI